MGVTTLTISAEHPALAGHFPGAPILPGVLLLDEMLHLLEREGPGAPLWRIGSAKFVKPVLPGDTLELEQQMLPNGTVRFQVSSRGTPVAHGLLVPARPNDEPHDDGPGG